MTGDARVFRGGEMDLDKPLHRIFPVWHLERAIQLRQLSLVKPTLWIDPGEDPCATFMLDGHGHPDKPRQQPLSDFLRPCWAQCWSYEADSDVLLRAYSRVALDPLIRRNTEPAGEGVRVTTTARRLVAAMDAWAARSADHHLFLAPVIYETPDVFCQSLVNRLSRPEGPNYYQTPRGRAESLLVKRAIFRHEDEVRLLCVGPGRIGDGETVRLMPIEPNDLFTEIRFDPRLIAFERIEREKRLVDLGYTGTIIEDSSYVKTFTLVLMPKGGAVPDPA